MAMTTTPRPPLPPSGDPRERARKLGFWGLLAHWDDLGDASWLEKLLTYEEEERGRRSLERRLQRARIGRFKPFADFDWTWPTKIERELIDEIFRFEFLDEAGNVVLMGPNGVGKTMIAQNL